MVWYCSLKLILHIIVIWHALWFGTRCFEYDYGTEIVVIIMLLLMIWILNIGYLTVRPESWRRLAFWCQSSRGVPVSIWIVIISVMICVNSYACILLLGVSSRVLFWPADKGKGKVNQPWAWRTWTLVHVGQLRGISMCCCVVIWVLVFVVRRHVFMLYWLNWIF